jgi:hypothetical protein
LRFLGWWSVRSLERFGVGSVGGRVHIDYLGESKLVRFPLARLPVSALG